MNIDVYDSKGKKVSSVEVKEAVFDGKVNEALIYEAVKMQQANRRAGTASTKSRGEVSGSGAKPWRQKGTGRARVGTKRNPIWRHGGVAFGPKPRDYSYSIPKKAAKGALRSAVQSKINDGKLRLIDKLELTEPRTKAVVEVFDGTDIGNALIVTETEDTNLKLGTRNLKDFKYIVVDALNVYDVLRYDELVMTKEAYVKLEGALAR